MMSFLTNGMLVVAILGIYLSYSRPINAALTAATVQYRAAHLLTR